MSLMPAYAKFLKTQALNDLVMEELTMLRQMDVPLLRLLSLKPEAEILEWLRLRETSFLAAMEEGRVMEWDMERLGQWERDAIPGIPKGGLHASDVLLFHTAQRSAMLRFVGRVTSDHNKKVLLLGELENHYTHVLAEAMRVFERMSGRAGTAPAKPKGPSFRGPVPQRNS